MLTIVAGLLGSQDAAHNVAMVLFWVVFLLAFAYLTLFIGDVYGLINPWRSLVDALECLGLDLSRPRAAYPPRLAYWPAFVLYAALIWMELFVAPVPRSLSIALLLYSALTFAGVALFGKTLWFERADPFAVFFRLIGILAPLSYRATEQGRGWQVQARAPFAGALAERPEHLSLVLFMLLVLAATSYDAIHETTLWVGLYWKNLLWLLQPLWGEDLGKAQETLMGGYLVYRQAGLVVFPFVYLALYWAALWGAKRLTRTALPTRSLALSFCYSLLPIIIAYHFTHYFPFLMDQAGYFAPTHMSVIWHTQVVVLLLGHVVSVYLAHRIAIQVFPTQRAAVMSQLPLLVLMVAYTIFGLWILSLPLAE